MAELRFQCFEVEKMDRARQGLMTSNTLLLAQAASARHRVEELARRSHLLQRIIRNMYLKVMRLVHKLDDGTQRLYTRRPVLRRLSFRIYIRESDNVPLRQNLRC